MVSERALVLCHVVSKIAPVQCLTVYKPCRDTVPCSSTALSRVPLQKRKFPDCGNTSLDSKAPHQVINIDPARGVITIIHTGKCLARPIPGTRGAKCRK